MTEYSAAAGHSFGYRQVDNPGPRGGEHMQPMGTAADRDELAQVVAAVVGAAKPVGFDYRIADAIMNLGWNSPRAVREIRQHWLETTRERDALLTELERLRNTPCFECGHS